MKLRLIILSQMMLLAFSQFSIAQEEEEVQTLFGPDAKLTGYGGPEIKFSRVKGTDQILVGGRGGTIINSTFSFGGAFYMMVTSPDVEYTGTTYFYENEKSYLRMFYGGLFFEYTGFSNRVAHFTINTLVGAGAAAITGPLNSKHNDRDYWLRDGSAFFIAEPGATLEFNIAKPFRIALGASYRFVSGLNLDDISNDDLSGISYNLTFKFGSF